MSAKIAFRADASIDIGSGHVMRCLTLADELKIAGHACHFLCRAHRGHLIETIRSKGHTAHVLPLVSEDGADYDDRFAPEKLPLVHATWLGCTQERDASESSSILRALQPQWLVVDHYALDARWERAMAAHSRQLMVIDDLADRVHVCDLLLDQTFGRAASDYRPLVPEYCRLLCGSEFALLRPEFAALRPYSLQRRAQAALKEVLITMGGVDKHNATGKVLQALRNCALPADCRITVVMGATAPWLEAVKTQAQDLTWTTRVLVGVSNMAQLMADSDLAIGAAGATSFERCCLGLPSIMLILADNQRDIGHALQTAGAAQLIEPAMGLESEFAKHLLPLLEDKSRLQQMHHSASEVTQGSGASHVRDLINQMTLERVV
jgi:UDP-2,4-diacetamido-2,4,6-trideoxy-beta-L-altropyranose hydrolase